MASPLRIAAFAWALAALLGPAHAAPRSDAPAVDTVQADWHVVHCGVANGVLYVTYVAHGKAGITAAVPSPAIREACAKAGHALGAGAPDRTPYAAPPPSVRPPAAPTPRQATRIEPTFTVQALGSAISIDGRNDGDIDYRCSINFSWTFDGDPTGPRSVTAQATLPGHQVNRVVSISGPYPNIRFVGQPMWNCLAAH